MNTGPEPSVAVVGAGPVGLLLALFLDHHGVRSVVFEAATATMDAPRGSTHGARTMEHYRRLGLAGRIRELGLPWDHATDIAFFTRYTGFEIGRQRRPPVRDLLREVDDGPATAQVPEPMHRANQMYVERLLLRHARSRPGVEVRLGCRVTDVRQDADGVWVHAEDEAGGRPVRRYVRYLAGCDGAHGVVRAGLGVRYSGEGDTRQEILGGRSVAAHLRIPAMHREVLTGRRAWSYWSVNPDLALNLIALDGREQFFLLTSSVDPDHTTADELATLVRRAIGAPVGVQVVGHRPWTAGTALVADRYRHGRIFLAGDAAHLFSPNGGFGMNTGLDDAANLAWKLAAAVRGWAGPRLTASYEAERRPVAVRNTGIARTLNLGLAGIRRSPGIERDCAEGEAERRRLGALLTDYAGRTLDTLGVQLGARYDGSPIVQGPHDPPPDPPDRYTPTSLPGGRTPHLWRTAPDGTRRSLFDELGPGFTLLRLGPAAPEGDALRAAATARGVPLRVLDVPEPHARELYERDLVLVRPDQHVAWRGNRLPDPDRVLDTVVGAAADQPRARDEPATSR